MSLGEKFWRWLGIEQETREEIEYQVRPTIEEPRGTGQSNVVSIHQSNKALKVIVFEPESFEEVQVLADHLKAKQEIILNMENTAPDVSQRIIDFISGTTYSLEGHSHQISKQIFVFTPSNVEISKDSRGIAARRSQFYAPGGGGR